MPTKKECPEAEDDALREYLMQDLALAKLRLNENQRNVGKLFCLVILLILLFIVCTGGFAATTYFTTKEHTRQLEALLKSGIEVSTVVQQERDHAYQEGVSGGAVLNNRSNISGSTITVK